jgi:hypothetical protein
MNSAFELIPDLGNTLERHLYKCMAEAGWEQKPLWNAKNLKGYQRIERQQRVGGSPWLDWSASPWRLKGLKVTVS